MFSTGTGRLRWPAAVLAIAALVVGGYALGSNMGFQISVSLLTGAPSPQGDNWVSLPVQNAFVRANNVCAVWGLVSTGPNASRAVVTRITPLMAFQNYTCGTSTLGAFTLVKGEAIKVRTPVPMLVPIAGSHDGAFAYTLNGGFFTTQAGNAPSLTQGCGNWVSLPYNFKWDRAQHVCTDAGLLGTGPNAGRGTVARLTASSGAFQTYTCGTHTLGAFALALPQAVRICTSVTASWVPSVW